MDLSKILTISGKPGLYKLVSQTKTGALVESLLDGKRMPVFATDRISSLEEISILCTEEDISLKKVFENLLQANSANIKIKHLSDKELKSLFKEIVPSYDEERVYFSDMKKVFSWYNLLLDKDVFTSEDMESAVKEVEAETNEEKDKTL